MAKFFAHQFHCIYYHRQHFMAGPWPDWRSSGFGIKYEYPWDTCYDYNAILLEHILRGN